MNEPANKEKDSNPEEKSQAISRRDFLIVGGVAAAGVAAALGGVTQAKLNPQGDDPRGEETVRNLPALDSIPKSKESDLLIRMQEELRQAMAKPVEKRHWMMVIDTRKCIGCHACTVACIAENKLPPGVVYRPVITEEIGVFPNLAIRFTPRPCMQCDNPPCTPVCPVKATWKRPDGIVTIDYDKCIGCGYCVAACPYNARTRDYGEYYTENTPAVQPYEKKPNFEYGKQWDRSHHGSPVGNARKCQFCVHRLEKGMLPECVTSCVGRATFFGDANSSYSLVTEMAAKPNAIRLLEEKGTKPHVVYLV